VLECASLGGFELFLLQCERRGSKGARQTGTYFAFASGRKQDKMRIGNALRRCAASSFGIALSLMLALGLVPADALGQNAEGGVIL